MNEHDFEWLVREAAREYNPPPAPPREAMWAAIQAERLRRRAARRPRLRPWNVGIGMAAMLAVGIGLGRLTSEPSGPGQARGPLVAGTPRTEPEAGLPYRLAATQHLSRTEAFLTSYRAEMRAGRATPELSAWAGDLLTTTRLLLDSPAADDPRLALLLQDLELILVQIAQLPVAADPDGEVETIDQAMEERSTLTRLRAAVPAGAAVTGT